MEVHEGGQEDARLAVDDELLFCRIPPSCSSESCDYSPMVAMKQCRICHEEEEESSTSMESPCACSGSLKFAHRECIQKWCDEKGSTLCEICLQNFEPGYTIPPKKALVEVAVTIRGSLEVPRLNYEPQNITPSGSATDISDLEYAECSRAAGRSASCCRSVAVTFTIVLLVRHLIAVLTVGADQYGFSLFTVYLLRASGILLPFYIILRLISAIQHGQRQYQMQQLEEQRRNAASVHGVEDDELQQYTIQIHET